MVEIYDHEMNVPTVKEMDKLPMLEMLVAQVHEVSMALAN